MNTTTQIHMPSVSASSLIRVTFASAALLLGGAAASAQDLAPKAAPRRGR